MKKILSSLFFSTATLGGVVGIVAQTNQAKPNLVPETASSAVQLTAATTPNPTQSALELEVEEHVVHPIATSVLPVSHTVSASTVSVPAETEELVAYEDVQAVRTGYIPAPEVSETKEVKSIENLLATSTPAPRVAEAPVATPVVPAPVETPVAPIVAPEVPAVIASEIPVAPVETPVAPAVETTPAPDAVPAPVETPVAETPVAPVAPVAETPASTDETVNFSVATPEVAVEAPVVPVEAPVSEAPVAEVPVVSAPVAPVEQPVASLAPAQPVVTPVSTAPAAVSTATSQNNTYPIGQCTWGVKSVAPWVGNNWGNASEWANSARAAGFSVGTTPVVGAVAVWPEDGGGYGHVGVVTSVESAERIQIVESNYNGHQQVGNYRGWFNPTKIWKNGGEVSSSVYYIYPSV